MSDNVHVLVMWWCINKLTRFLIPFDVYLKHGDDLDKCHEKWMNYETNTSEENEALARLANLMIGDLENDIAPEDAPWFKYSLDPHKTLLNKRIYRIYLTGADPE